MTDYCLKRLFYIFSIICLFVLTKEKGIYAQTSQPSDSTSRQFIHLNTPSNIRNTIRYDYKRNIYIFEKHIGDEIVTTTQIMTPEEYRQHLRQQSQLEYFRNRNSISSQDKPTIQQYILPNRNRKKGPLESIFGPGGVQLTGGGYIELSSGFKTDVVDNPTLPQRARRRSRFDFDTDINLNMNAKVGDKVDFNVKYNSNAGFDIDSRQIKLGYQGNEDDIVKNIQAGNVSMTTTNSLINGGAALFGIKTDLQFGKLHINTVFSQQKSKVQTIQTENNVSSSTFNISALDYDANRHFFLSQYFRNNYDNALSKMPYIQSKVSITRLEVWVTNKRGEYSQSRDIIAFADLAEHSGIKNNYWSAQGTSDAPHNDANNLYKQLASSSDANRDINQILQQLPSDVVQGIDYEKLENAKLLTQEDYTFHPQLGYISLRVPLLDDEILAVAYEYTYGGEVYQVGEFSNNLGNSPSVSDPDNGGTNVSGANMQNGALLVKLLKPVSMSPNAYTWDLMMKNIYSIGYNVSNIKKDRFKVDITYRDDSNGLHMTYITEGNIKDELLIRVMNLDRLNERSDPYPDGIFDYLEGLTIDSDNGLIIFPVVEPFGSHLRKMIGNDAIADKYVFQELYSSTRSEAYLATEKNKFALEGEYQGSTTSGYNLNTMNVARGSVRVTAAGEELVEGTDYMVDYLTGEVTIINQSILDAGTPVNITMENQPFIDTQRKTLMGVNLLYDINKNLSIGGTLMHYYEKPMIIKTAYGNEASKNTLWGANLIYDKESYIITNLLNMIPFVEATQPSRITANLEFAQMLPGHYKNKYMDSYSYLDDFETSTFGIDLSSPYSWSLAATPFNSAQSSMFPEASLINNIEYGKNRAQLAWFYIDGIFTRKNSALTPTHIKNDLDQLSNHFVREIYEKEIFPNRDTYYGISATLPVLNLSYYPNERGPYNLDTNVDQDGYLNNPKTRWGGITRRMDTRDFEDANIEYLEFWLMDPFVNDTLGTYEGGDLYINFGDISEDILKDGKKFFENGLPLNGDTTQVGYSVWGKYPKRQSTVYAFDNSKGIDARKIQDVGLNGLSTEEEKAFPSYQNYISELKNRLSPYTISMMEDDPHSPINDPSGDNYSHYRGAEQDRRQLSILERYKYINGTEGNSTPPEGEKFAGVSKTTPDVEDLNNDNTLNENESYYSYRIQLRPNMMQVGKNHISDKREVSVKLRNGNESKVTWYQFKIPIKQYDERIGNIRGFNNIRFMRMFLTQFEEPTFLRFATLRLVQSEWRNYKDDPLEISAVNIEENSSRTPVNYVMPPGVSRIIDPGQPQLRQENEQSLAIKSLKMQPGENRSIAKNFTYDLRRYKTLQMFIHAEEPAESTIGLYDGDVSLFMRLGTDYEYNYYEYEVPLSITPEGKYSPHSQQDREKVWPLQNMINLPLKYLTDIKLQRNAENKNKAELRYSKKDPDKPENTITIAGNPSLAEIRTIIIGVRNNTNSSRSVELWVNELRLADFDEKGGYAAQANINMALSDIGTVNLSGRRETAGFGSLDQNLLQRRNDDLSSFNIALNLDLGRFMPKAIKLSAPFYYSFSNNITTPLYDPLNKDILMSESIQSIKDPTVVDSLKNMTITKWNSKSLSLSGANMNIKSSNAMPYDPANFRFTYSYNSNRQQDPETEYATVKDWRLQIEYQYAPSIKPWTPFKNSTFQIGYLPSNIRINSNIMRNYKEVQLRSISTTGAVSPRDRFLSFSHNFLWNRDLNLSWNFTRNLVLNFQSGTIAEIEEPYLQVNKQINRNDYEVWKDSVMQSIADFGKPLSYRQKTSLNWELPFSLIPSLNWINTSASYNSSYHWERGALINDAEIGNFLQNDLAIAVNSRISFSTLYEKIFKSKAETENNDFIQSLKDFALLIKNINTNLSYRTRTDLPGYKPMIGDFLGQLSTSGKLQPGLPFALGIDGGLHFINNQLADNKLIINEENITPALYNETKNLTMEILLEPVKNIKINLNFLYEDNQRTEFRYMIPGMPTIKGGSFAITTMSLFSSFEKHSASNNYQSDVFDKFLVFREDMAYQVRSDYSNTRYPENGFLKGTELSGKLFDRNIRDINPNSSEVLIPAFLKAYTGRKSAVMLPNWDITYNIQNFTLSHRYTSQYRIGNYSSHLGWIPAIDASNDEIGFIKDPITGNPIPSSPYDIPSVSIIESFNPLIELQTDLQNDITLNMRINKSRSLNLNITSYRLIETSDNELVLGGGYKWTNFNRIIGFGSNSIDYRRVGGQSRQNEFSNDMLIRFDISSSIKRSLIRKLEDGFTQATSGIRTTSLRFSADYAMSRRLNLKAFYDKIIYRPMVSSNSYPTTNSSAGIALRVNL